MFCADVTRGAASVTQIVGGAHLHRACRRCQCAWIEKLYEPPSEKPVRKKRRVVDDD